LDERVWANMDNRVVVFDFIAHKVIVPTANGRDTKEKPRVVATATGKPTQGD
jgi:hypothetical protein